MKKILSILLSVSLLLMMFQISVFANETTESGISVISTGFTDLQNDYDYYPAVTYLSQIGVLNGYADGTFRPDNTINRAEVLKIIMAGSAVDTTDATTEDVFFDVPMDAWYKPYVNKGYELGIVKGDGTDGGFHGEREVNEAEFLKMLLEANQIKQEALDGATSVTAAPDVPSDAWFAPYLNYSALVGIIEYDDQGNLQPNKVLTRGEVANMMYLLMLIKGKYNTQLLLDAAELEMIQIDVFVGADKIDKAKRSSELAVDVTQQALINKPDDNVVLGVAKLAKAYDFLMQAFILGAQGDTAGAEKWANDAIDKAGEAWVVDNDTEIVARHIKEVARSILDQVGGTET